MKIIKGSRNFIQNTIIPVVVSLIIEGIAIAIFLYVLSGMEYRKDLNRIDKEAENGNHLKARILTELLIDKYPEQDKLMQTYLRIIRDQLDNLMQEDEYEEALRIVKREKELKYWFNGPEHENLIYDSLRNEAMEKLSKKEHDRAIARIDRMFRLFPKKDEQIQDLCKLIFMDHIKEMVAGKEYERALNFLDEEKKKRDWLEIFEFEKHILLDEARHFIKKNNYAVTYNAYKYLLGKRKNDPEIHWEIVRNIGADWEDGPSSTATYSAMYLAESMGDTLESLVGRTILESLENNNAFSEYIIKRRKLLEEKFPPCIEWAYQNLDHKRTEARSNSFFILKETEKLTDTQEIYYHLRNLAEMENQIEIENSIEFFNGKGREKWEQSGHLVSTEISTIACLDTFYASFTGDLLPLLSDVFIDEIRKALPVWLHDKNSMWLRLNAHSILEMSGLSDEVDLLKFHLETLEMFPSSYGNDYFDKTLSFLKDQAKKRKNTIVKAFKASIKRFNEMADEYGRDSQWGGYAIKKVELVEKALAEVEN